MSVSRKRTLYISSENVDYFNSSDRVTINLNQSVVHEDDFILTYALKSIGFNSTAMNISEKQKNNKICYVLEYNDTHVTHVARKDAPDGDITSVVTRNLAPNEVLTIQTVTVVVPDGHYTLSELFVYLSSYSNKSIVIPSGYYLDYEDDIEAASNIVPILFQWAETPSGYTIELKSDYLLDDIKGTYTYGGTDYGIRYLFSKLNRITIAPHETDPILFNTLFTNFNTEYENTPISIPPNTMKRGVNPHSGVQFNFNINSLTRPDQITDIKIVEVGNERLYDVVNRIYPTEERINYHFYKAYYKPNLDPTYVDVMISLPNSAMDERGHRNILTRIFTLGSKDGGSSFFQMWEQPKITVLNGLSGFSSVTIDIESQENKWNFFNLEFSIEIEIDEIKEEVEQNIEDPAIDLDIPVTDAVDDAARTNGRRHQSALPKNHFYQHRGGQLQIPKRSRYA